MNWDDYRYFLAVARHRTLKLAAKNLNVDQATVGRRVSALQERLGTRLLEKRSDGFFVTAAGSRILEGVEQAENAMLTIDRSMAGNDERVEGKVRIALPGALANQIIISSLETLLKKNPKLEIQLLTGPELLNISRREADIAVRLVRPEQRDLKTRKVGVLKLGLYGTKKVSHLYDAADLSKVPFVGLFDDATSRLERDFLAALKFVPRYQLRSTAWETVYLSIKSGIGIGILPTFFAEFDDSMLAIKQDRSECPLWLVVHPEMAVSARVRLVIDHLAHVLSGK